MPHDLTTERRIRATLDQLREALTDDDIHDRFTAYLGHLLTEGDMPESPTSMRLPEAWLEKAEHLAEHYARTGEYAAFGSMTRATVLRLAIQEGLKLLEERKAEADSTFMESLGA